MFGMFPRIGVESSGILKSDFDKEKQKNIGSKKQGFLFNCKPAPSMVECYGDERAWGKSEGKLIETR